MRGFYFGCEFIYMAIQIWVFFGLIASISEPKRERRTELLVKLFSAVLLAVLNTYNNSISPALFSNSMLLLLMAFVVFISGQLFQCKRHERFLVCFIFFVSIAIGDFFMQTTMYFALEALNLPENLMISANVYRGIYLLIYAIGVLWWGKKLERWLITRSIDSLRFHGGNIVLIPMLALCMIYFQRIYKLDVSEKFMSHWWVFALSIALMIIIVWAKNIKREDDEQLRILNLKTEMWEDGYQNLLQLQEERKILQHDIVHHLCMIREMLDSDQRDEIRLYVDKLTEGLKVHRNEYKTNHSFLDLVLNRKLQEAKAAQIQVECKCDDMSELKLNPTDICALFCNLLDNAIEANEKRREGERRWLRLVCTRDGEMLIIFLSNLMGGKPLYIESGRLPETTKADKKLHGCGLRSIQQVLGTYNGYMKIETEEEIFNISICLVGFEHSKEETVQGQNKAVRGQNVERAEDRGENINKSIT